MKRILMLCLASTCLGGCSFTHKMKATEDAIKAGRIEGLALSNDTHVVFTTWSWPSKPLGPYSKIAGFTGYKPEGTNAGPTYVFYLGKSRERKTWEVFAAMVWEGGKWKPVGVQLPEGSTP